MGSLWTFFGKQSLVITTMTFWREKKKKKTWNPNTWFDNVFYFIFVYCHLRIKLPVRTLQEPRPACGSALQSNSAQWTLFPLTRVTSYAFPKPSYEFVTKIPLTATCFSVISFCISIVFLFFFCRPKGQACCSGHRRRGHVASSRL